MIHQNRSFHPLLLGLHLHQFENLVEVLMRPGSAPQYMLFWKSSWRSLDNRKRDLQKLRRVMQRSERLDVMGTWYKRQLENVAGIATSIRSVWEKAIAKPLPHTLEVTTYPHIEMEIYPSKFLGKRFYFPLSSQGF
jgi:hypothetical protein